MPIIFEKDIDKYYDENELKLIRRGSGLFPAGHYPRKERSGAGLMDIIAQGARIFKFIGDNKKNISNVGSAVASVFKAGSEIKNAITNTPTEQVPIQTLPPVLAPPIESVDPQIYQKLRESVKKGEGFKYD